MKKHFILPALTACFLGLSFSSASAAGLSTQDSHFLTEADVDDIFGELPRYFDLGSFPLNRLNHIPMPSFEDHYMLVENKDGSRIKTRPSFSLLQDQLEKLLSSYQGDWSIYIKDLKTGEIISINEHPMQSASLIKLYIAGTTLERIENGLLEETETIRNALRQMIVVSDNESSNVLVRSFYKESEGQHFQDGLDIVNDFNERHGYTNTTQVNGIADPSLWINDGSVNQTSTADCGKILEDIYNSELISHFASFRFEKMLNNQEVNYKIPSALPEGTHISHKTGEVSDTENDAAIIYTPYGDYIYCIMSTELTSTSTAVDNIRAVTKIVHNWFTHPFEIIEPEKNEPEKASGE